MRISLEAIREEIIQIQYGIQCNISNLPKTPHDFFVDSYYLFRKDEEACMAEYLPVITGSQFKGFLEVWCSCFSYALDPAFRGENIAFRYGFLLLLMES